MYEFCTVVDVWSTERPPPYHGHGDRIKLFQPVEYGWNLTFWCNPIHKLRRYGWISRFLFESNQIVKHYLYLCIICWSWIFPRFRKWKSSQVVWSLGIFGSFAQKNCAYWTIRSILTKTLPLDYTNSIYCWFTNYCLIDLYTVGHLLL